MAIYQISKALIEYHNYATIIESQFIESNRTILPKVTICSQHITMDGRDDRYPGGTAKYRLYNSVRMSEMVHHCRITLPNGSKSNCTEQGSEIGSVNCAEMFRVGLIRNNSFWSKMSIVSIYDDQPTVFEGDPNMAMNYYPYLREIMYTFQTQIHRSQSYPYDTQCLNYRELFNGRSKRDMVDNCTAEKTLSTSEQDIPALPADQLIDEQSVTDRNGNEAIQVELLQSERDHCFDRYWPPECDQTQYIIETKRIRLQEPLNLDQLSSNHPEYVIVQPKQPELLVTARPRIKISIFMSNIGGLLGLWTGFCVEDISDQALNLLASMKMPPILVGIERLAIIRQNSSKTARIRLVAWLICSIGFAIQSFMIINLYFESPFVTESQIVPVSHIKIPQVSICSDYEHWNPWQTGPKRFQGLGIKHNESGQYWFLQEEGVIRANRNRKCYTFFRDQSRWFPQSFSEIVNMNWAWFQLYLNHFRMYNVSFLVHDESTFPDQLDSESSEWIRKPVLKQYMVGEYWFIYQNQSKRLIEDHTFSQCTNYERFGFRSRYEAIQNCTVDLHMALDGSLPPSSYVELRLKEENQYRFSSDYVVERSIHELCNRTFSKPDCYSEQYKLDILYVNYADQPIDMLIFYLMGPQTTEIRIVQKVRFTVLELFCYVGSFMGCWLGLSMLDIGVPLIELGQKAILRRQIERRLVKPTPTNYSDRRIKRPRKSRVEYEQTRLGTWSLNQYGPTYDRCSWPARPLKLGPRRKHAPFVPYQFQYHLNKY